MATMRKLICLALPLLMVAGLTQCNKDSGNSTSSSASAGGSSQVSPNERDAREAVLSEIGKRWVKGPDGWTTAKTMGVSIAPDHFLRQIKEISVSGVMPDDLSEADKANGFEWAGEVSFKESLCREAGDQGILLDGLANQTIYRRRGAWTQWVDFKPDSIKVQKLKGKWQIPEDQWFLRSGKTPTAADFANAGVK